MDFSPVVFLNCRKEAVLCLLFARTPHHQTPLSVTPIYMKYAQIAIVHVRLSPSSTTTKTKITFHPWYHLYSPRFYPNRWFCNIYIHNYDELLPSTMFLKSPKLGRNSVYLIFLLYVSLQVFWIDAKKKRVFIKFGVQIFFFKELAKTFKRKLKLTYRWDGRDLIRKYITIMRDTEYGSRTKSVSNFCFL